jgi:bifunctional non-homologous end joining protein LigD
VPPKFVRPCIPAARKSVPHGAGWLHEPKLDGYRLQVVKEGRLVRLYSKGGYDWTKRLARLTEALTGIPCQSAVRDVDHRCYVMLASRVCIRTLHQVDA